MALSGKFISIRVILDRVISMYETDDFDRSDVIAHAADALEKLRVHQTFEQKVDAINIEDYLGDLPCNIIQISQVRAVIQGRKIPMRYATDKFHPNYACEEKQTKVADLQLPETKDMQHIIDGYDQQVYTATAGQTVFNLPVIPVAAWVWVEGVAQEPQYWYLQGEKLIFKTGITAGYEVSIYYAEAKSVSDILEYQKMFLSSRYRSVGVLSCMSTPTYIINKNHIQTSFREGCVEMAYTAAITDKEGFPMIPQDIEVQLALESYVIERILYKQFLRGKVNRDVWQVARQNAYHAMGSAVTWANTPSLDQMQSIKNIWVRLINNVPGHNSFYNDTGNPESMRKFR